MGSETENGRIDCYTARELFFDVSEKTLNKADADALHAHEASCEECRRQFDEWSPLRSALRNPGLRVAAAPGFTAGVMARIAEVAPGSRTAAKASGVPRFVGYLKNSVWGKGIAAAAVILALLTGSVSLATRMPVWQIARHNPGPDRTIDRTIQDQRNSEKVTNSNTPVTEDRREDVRPAPVKPAPTPPAKDTGKEPGNGTTARVASGNNGNAEKVFLNKTRFITSSLLRLKVSNLEQARSAAMSLALKENARLQSEYTTQNEGHQNIILRLTVPNEQAQPFVKRLAELGTVVTQDASKKDITAEFASTLKEYQSLKAQQAAAPESEKERLDSQIAFLEKQLQSWDEESNKQVVILILEEQ